MASSKRVGRQVASTTPLVIGGEPVAGDPLEGSDTYLTGAEPTPDTFAESTSVADAPRVPLVHFLDVGEQEYGDCVLCQFGSISVLIDGAHTGDQHGTSAEHPGIPAQLAELLGQSEDQLEVSLLIVTHAHQDHIGCLPYLIKHGLLHAEWALVADPKLGWGRRRGEDAVTSPGDSVARIAAGLREEPLDPRTDRALIDQFLLDAVTLESRYKAMLDDLRSAGTRVVRYGRDDPRELVRAFREVGLQILGPTQEQLLACAKLIEGGARDAAEVARAQRLGDIYATLVAGARNGRDADDLAIPALAPLRAEAIDAGRGGKGAVNDQSLVIRFLVNGIKMLFTGDMQFEEPEVSSDVVLTEIKKLRHALEKDGPYDLVKLSHHGSYNGFSEELLREWGGTFVAGICAGENSTSHPNHRVLDVLNENRSSVTWARTDRNGRSTFRGVKRGKRISVTRGDLNDPRPNAVDLGTVGLPAAIPSAPTGPTSPPRSTEHARPSPEHRTVPAGASVHFQTQIEHGGTRVTISVRVEPHGESPVEVGLSGPNRPPARDELAVAGGRHIPMLLYVTDAERLAANIGRAEAQTILAAIRRTGAPLLDRLPLDIVGALSAVRDAVRSHALGVAGVCLVGGYDVVPAARIDCLPADLRRQIRLNEDPDDFIVWSDDPFVDIDGDDIPELPISRLPDAHSAAFLERTVSATAQIPAAGWPRRLGIRNLARPYADVVFAATGGAGPLLSSEPTAHDQRPPYDVSAEALYLMLHGDNADGTRFWGERPNGSLLEVVNISSVKSWVGRTVFAGCCWGGLTVNTLAKDATPGVPLGVRPPEASLALSYLDQGALAFVGCTGAHYSPVEAPYEYHGGAMHKAFWGGYDRSKGPADALFRAKLEFLDGVPHGRSSRGDLSVTHKTARQFTCLGLGW
jgi:glyoxylase-like metal-dependent hydrolase (beta-lactamase superfamily II)